MHHRQDRRTVIQAVKMAVWQRQEAGEVILHSDRGCQFTSADYQKCRGSRSTWEARLWSAVGVRLVTAATTRPARGFFGVLKRERVHHRSYRTRNEARADLFDYIERFHIRGCGVEWPGKIRSFQLS